MHQQILILGFRNNLVNKYSQRRSLCFLDTCTTNHCVTTNMATVTQRVGKFLNDLNKIKVLKCKP